MSVISTTLVELLRQRSADQTEQDGYIFLIDGEKEGLHLTYKDLDCQARAIGALLQSHGVSGERVLLLYPPGLEYIAAFFGCLYAGAIAVPAYPPANKRHIPRIQGIVEDAQAHIALTIEKTRAKIQKWLTQTSALSTLQLLTTDTLTYEEAKDWKKPEIKSNDLAFLQYTSGSTARPKGVMLTHSNLLYNLDMIYKYFEHTPESKGVIWLPPYHDMGLIGGILQPLFGGFPVILMSPAAFLQRPICWLQAISKYRATTSGGPNFAYDLCVQKISPEQCERLDLSSWNLAFSGAEPIRHETLESFVSAFKLCGFRKEAFYPCYGLAEATLFVSGGKKADLPVVRDFDKMALEYDRVLEVPEEALKVRRLIGCGQTLPDQELIIVNPKFLTRCLADQVGEIWVSGPGVAQGYWDQPDETKNNFQANPLVSRDKKFLRTGDLGFLRDGELFITGRLKDLIIIRGRNHYPEDIEWHMEQSYPALREDGSAAFSVNINGEEQLVVVAEIERRYQRKLAKQGQRRSENQDQPYALGFSPDLDQAPDFTHAITNIRQTIAKLHDLQVYAVLLLKYGFMPRTSSGKIQRHACREGFLEGTLDVLAEWSFDRQLPVSSAPYKVPQTDTEKTVATLCTEVFGVERVGLHDSFFELGGDSLTIIQLASRVRDTFQKDIALSDFFEISSVAELAALIETLPDQLKEEAELQKIPRQLKSDSAPLSFAQQRLWFFDQLEPGSIAYNLSMNFRLKGHLNIDALEQSIQEIIRRHDILRTTCVAKDGQPIQIIAPTLEKPLIIKDLSDLPKAESLAEAHRLAIEVNQYSFDLTKLPLFLLVLLKLGEKDYIFSMTAHHIIFDEWSFGIFMQELTTLYEAFSSGNSSPLHELPVQYADFAEWHNKWLQQGILESQLMYWKNRLSGRLPILELPTDHPRLPKPTLHGKTQSFTFSRTLSEELNQLSRREGCTIFMTLLTAFSILLYRYTGQEDLIVGSPVANRRRTELEHLLGFFVNTLVLRLDLSGNPTFKEVLQRVRKVALEGYVHQDLPFERLVDELHPKRKLDQNPLFQVMFVFQNAPIAKLKLPGLIVIPFEVESSTSLFDLTVSMEETEHELMGEMIYNSDLFETPTIIRMIRHFRNLLRTVAEHPQQRISEISFLLEAERRQLLSEWNNVPVESSQGKCVHELFEFQVERTPEAIAVVRDEQIHFTYRELNTRANQLAHYLRSSGIGPGKLVGLCVERSLEMIVGLLGILKSNGAYLPLDSEYPEDRLVFMLSDSEVSVLLTQKKLAHKFAGYNVQVVCLDSDWEMIAQSDEENLSIDVTLEDLACVFYTSGSTGIPKGAMISHRALVNFTETAIVEYEITRRDRILQYASISFDAATEEIYPCLISGARLVLLREEERLISVPLLLQKCREYGLTVLDLPTAYWHLMVSEVAAHKRILPDSVRLVIIGGERAMPEKLKLWRKVFGDYPELVNTYGPTEATVVATRCKCSGASLTEEIIQKAPIGWPLRHVNTYVLDQHLQLVPVGVPGELHIGGEALARGYLKRPALTAEKFIPDPFSTKPNKRLYKTGDLARYLPDGRLEFLGRIDHQVKIRGLRVELGEIETTLAQHPTVQEVVVVAQEDVSQNKQLVAYIAFHHGQQTTEKELRDFLKKHVPGYMIPSIFIFLDALPLTTSGKVDRRALPDPEAPRSKSETTYVMPQTETEQFIAAVWQEALQAEKVGLHDNFFDLGGHSLLTIQIHSKLQEKFGEKVKVVDLFQYPTVHSLTTYLSQAEQEPSFEETSKRVESRSSRGKTIRQQRQRRQKHRTTSPQKGDDT